MSNAEALTYWTQKKYSAADVRAVIKDLDAWNILAIAIEFLPNANINCVLTTKLDQRYQSEGHLRSIVTYFSNLHTASGGNIFRGWIIVWAEDCIWDRGEPPSSQRAPIFAFCRDNDDLNTLLMPDPAFIGNVGYRTAREEIEEVSLHLPWERKQPTVFWRGSSSGPGLNGEDWQNVPRIHLCLKAKELNVPMRLDVALSHLIAFDNPLHKQRIVDLDILKEKIPFREFLNYRYQVDIDGFGCAWMSYFKKLASHCLTLKVESKSRQWYYDRLIPWTHYIPIKDDLSDLFEIIDWLPTHDTEAHTIAENAHLLMKNITFEAETLHVVETLLTVLAAQRE